jgi:hypothetical protein
MLKTQNGQFPFLSNLAESVSSLFGGPDSRARQARCKLVELDMVLLLPGHQVPLSLLVIMRLVHPIRINWNLERLLRLTSSTEL